MEFYFVAQFKRHTGPKDTDMDANTRHPGLTGTGHTDAHLQGAAVISTLHRTFITPQPPFPHPSPCLVSPQFTCSSVAKPRLILLEGPIPIDFWIGHGLVCPLGIENPFYGKPVYIKETECWKLYKV